MRSQVAAKHRHHADRRRAGDGWNKNEDEAHLGEDEQHLEDELLISAKMSDIFRSAVAAACAVVRSRRTQNPLRGRRVARAGRGWSLHSRTAAVAMPRKRSFSRGGSKTLASSNDSPKLV